MFARVREAFDAAADAPPGSSAATTAEPSAGVFVRRAAYALIAVAAVEVAATLALLAWVWDDVTSIVAPPEWRELGEEACDGLPDCASWIPLAADFMQDGAAVTGTVTSTFTAPPNYEWIIQSGTVSIDRGRVGHGERSGSSRSRAGRPSTARSAGG